METKANDLVDSWNNSESFNAGFAAESQNGNTKRKSKCKDKL